MDIKDFQLRYGVTNQKMAELCGCSLPTIQKWRSGTINISGAAERLLKMLDHLSNGSPERLSTHLNALNGHADWVVDVPPRRETAVISDLEQSVSKAVRKFELALELRHKQDELATSESRYRAMVETQTEAICRWTPDTTLTFVNEAHCRFFGQTQEELIGRRWTDFIPEAEQETTRSYIQRMVSTKTHRRYEQRVRSRNGREVVLEWTDTPLVKPDGAVAEIQSVGRDITARVRAEEDLHAKLGLEKIITRLSSALLGGDQDHAEEVINTCLAKLGAFASADRAYICLFSGDRQTFGTAFEWCAEGIPPLSDRCQNLDRSRFPWGMSKMASPDPLVIHSVDDLPADARSERAAFRLTAAKSCLIFPINAGKVQYGMVGFMTVREKKAWRLDEVGALRMVAEMLALYYAHEQKTAQVEQQRRRIEQDAAFVRTLLDAIPFPIFSKNRELEYSLCNRAFAQGIGFDLADLEGKAVRDVAMAELAAQYHQMDHMLLEQGGEQTYESQVLFADGTLHDILFTKAVYGDGTDAAGGIVGIMQDVTERNRAQMLLQQAKERAESAAMTKTRLLSNVSHELRAPVHVVLAMSEFLQGKAGGIDETERVEVLGLITDAARQLWVMIDELLALSHIERGRLRVNHHPFDLHALCEQLGTYHQKLAEDKGLTYSWTLADDLPRVINSSEYRIRQVLIQLISNALKFTERGAVSVRCARDCSGGNGRKDAIRFDVHDTGIGIDEESQELIYRAFEQMDASNLKRHNGLGIGLAVARRLARGLGGDIRLESTEGGGAHFSFTLPVELQESAPADPAEDPSVEQGATVMVVDDNALNRMVMCRMLERMGLRTLSVDGGCQALDLLASDRCDMILVDIQMPNMDGFELLGAIREFERANGRPEVPVVAVTAYALPTERNRFIKAGMSEFLPKPFTFDELKKVIRRVRAGETVT